MMINIKNKLKYLHKSIKRKIYLIPLFFIIILFIILRFPYRDYVYKNQLFDFYIADTFPNFLGVFLCVFLERMTSKHNDGLLFVCTIIFLALVLYEICIQPYLFAQTYDFKDLVATFIGYIACIIVCAKMENLNLKRVASLNIDLNKKRL